ncbi:phage terminase large subunit family protein [Roseomonas chloroacetimidivorans]|uniref:phage terminase large subunit family protein n=1 Tax=Roseomonas chloroacetimidivorans TaxID=1766656 RepID=UPI003C70DF8F
MTRTLRRLAPPPRLSLSQWADTYRYLSAETSAEPGRWSTARAEYLREIMDTISDPRVERVVFMASARVGKTEVINNLCGFHIGQDPAPILVVYPTETAAEEWSRDKLAPMLRDSPSLRSKIAPARSRDSQNTTLHKVFPGGRLYIVGANAPTGLAAKNIRIVCFDEVDRYGANAGGEGDPIGQGVKRTQNFWNRKIVIVSSPKKAGTSRIEAEYERSDKRRYWVPCPHCDEPQVLKWAQVRWNNDLPTPEAKAADAAYHCEHCGAAWSDADRWEAVATARRRGGGWRAERPGARVAGFHISVLYSPWRTIEETVTEFLACSSPEELQVFVNTSLGETWREKGEAPEWERLLERREEFAEGVLPRGALILTAGADCQGDRIEARVWAWGPGFEQWLVAREIFMGSPAVWETWAGVRQLLARTFPAEDGGPEAVIARMAVDTGGHDTAAVYGHLRRLADVRIMPVKGGNNASRPVSQPSYVDAKEGARKLRRALRLWTINSGHWKGELYSRLRQPRTGEGFPPGWVHLPAWIDAEECQQLVSEEFVTVQTRQKFSRQEWRKLRERNEALDCEVYARAALSELGADRMGDRFWTQYARSLGGQMNEEDVGEVLRPAASAESTADTRPPAWINRPSTWISRRGR